MWRWSITLAVVSVLCAAAAVCEDTSPAPPISCANGLIGSINCIPTKKEIKQAREAFDRGVKLHSSQELKEAFSQFDDAVRLDPRNMNYLTAREMVKAKLVFNHIQQGNLLLASDARLRAAAEFRAALDFDPENAFAHERFVEATQSQAQALTQIQPEPWDNSTEIVLQPPDSLATFHFSGDSKGLFTQLAAA